MNILLVPIGSHGDVHPFVGLGIELARRGHSVTVITNGHFRSLVEAAQLRFVEFGSDEEYRLVMRDPDLWHPRRGARAVFGATSKGLRLLYDLLANELNQGPALIVTSVLGFAARVLQEQGKARVVMVHLAPAVMRTLHEMPVFIPGLETSRWPRLLKRVFWSVADRMVDPHICPALNELRREVGLPPVRRIMAGWIHSPLLTVGMFPAWFGPPQPDWPASVRLTGFPLFDERGVTALPAGLEDFLHAGSAPVVFTPGSAMVRGQDFFRAATGACVKLRCRGLLLTRFAEQIPADLPGGVRHYDYAPLSLLLPRCAALVHHGGVGTTAQALAAGRPQLIRPLAHDQFDNAARAVKLGVGRTISAGRSSASRLAAGLNEVLGSPVIRRRCAEIASRFHGVDALAQTCDLIERVG